MKSIIVSSLIGLCAISGISQKTPTEEKADKKFSYFNYKKAIKKYEKVSDLSTSGLRNLAESYRLSSELPKAEETYAKLVEKEDKLPEDLYYYSYVLKENKKYLESEKWMDKFKSLASTDNRVKHYTEDGVEISDLLVDKGQFEIKHLSLNTAQEDFGPSYYGDQVVFASSREGVKVIKRRWNGNNLPFLNLYVADKDSSSELVEPFQLSRKTNKKYHEGPASFAKGEQLMAFTRNNYEDKSSDGIVKLKIFFSEKVEGTWSEPVAFDLNNKEYSVGQPYLTEDGNTMYFSSDMPGGLGGADIYKITRTEGGEWSGLENLGPTINTEGNEMFPYYHESQELLLFSSDGQVGIGGLDLYVSKENNGKYSKVKNLGVPLNSSTDDFGMILSKDSKGGYFSSNREGGRGDDDIYGFEMLKPFIFGKRIEGIAKDKEGNILSNVLVNLYQNGEVVRTATTSTDGAFNFVVDPDLDFTLDGTREKYFPGKNSVSTRTKEEVVKTDVVLEKDPGLSLYALVTDSKSKAALEGVTIKLTDNLTGKEEVFVTPSTGDHRKALVGKKLNDRGSYNLALSKEGYFSKIVTYNTLFDKPGIYNVHNELDLSMDKEVADLAELVEINPINFDLNKYNIRPDAEVELDKIVEIMNKYGNMEVELGAHTDCRGSKAYNERLSDKRAKASAAYIKSKIINPDRIYGKGYGESILLNSCACEGSVKSSCSEEEHSLNRRTEFKVISIGSDKVQVKNNSTDSFGK